MPIIVSPAEPVFEAAPPGPANMLQLGASWLAGQVQRSAGRQVLLMRGGVGVACLTGTSVEQDYEVVLEDGSLTTVHAVDWSFSACQLPVLRAGDRLREALQCQIVEYELVPIGKKPPVENLDSSGILRLVHTKRVAPGS